MNIFSSSGLLVLTLLVLCWPRFASAGTWTTGRSMEVDRCASAWLIKTHIDPQATFQLIEDKTLVTTGTAFDLPVAELRRDQRRSTYDALVHTYALKNAKVLALGLLVHDIEINFAGVTLPEAKRLENELRHILHLHSEPQGALQACMDFLDTYSPPAEKGAIP